MIPSTTPATSGSIVYRLAAMDAIANQIKSPASDADGAERKHILDSLRHVSDSIETPQDTMQRLMYLVRSATDWARATI